MQNKDAALESISQQEELQSEDAINTLEGLWGAMHGTIMVAPSVDLTEPTGETWKAMQDDYKGCC